MKITTWNILAPMWSKHYFSSQKLTKQYVSIQHRRPIILNTLKNLQSDIFLLQEVQKGELAFYRRNLPNYRIFFAAHSKKHWKEYKPIIRTPNGNAIFVKKGTFRKFKIRRVRLHDNGNTAIFLLTKAVVISSVHLSEKRKTNIKQLTRLLNYVKENTGKIILGGDYNYTDINLVEKWGFKLDHRKDTCIEKNMSCSLDHIFYKGVVGNVKVPRLPKSCYRLLEKYGSDHIPISLNFVNL